MAARIVFIASLGHSGSTLMDLLLGAHPEAVSLGEIYSAIQRFDEPQRTCTCGSDVDSCLVWAPVREWARAHPSRPFGEAYRRVIAAVSSVYGDNVTVVDSSKYLAPLRTVVAEYPDQVRVLHLVKDVRSYLASRARLPRGRGPAGWIRHTALAEAVGWRRNNGRVHAYLEQNDIPSFQFGYEELCFDPERILRLVCDFAGLPFVEAMLAPNNGSSHIIRGNEMRFRPHSLRGVTYDHRWLESRSLAALQPVLLPFMSWNARHVYKNLGSAHPELRQE